MKSTSITLAFPDLGTKETFDSAKQEYLSKLEALLSEINEEELKKKLREIKERCISKLPELISKAKSNLEKQGIFVYEAKTAKDVHKILSELIPENSIVAKSKSNIMRELQIKEALLNRCTIFETDCGDFIVDLLSKHPLHVITPAIGVDLATICKKLKASYDISCKPEPESIVSAIRTIVESNIRKASIGLSGANAVSADGAIFIVENEGNIGLINRSVKKHIIICGIERIVENMNDALTICKALAIYGTGTFMPSYINLIGSPSKTADIEKKLIYGVHGASEIHLILVDNGRSNALKSEFKEALYCISCGSCAYFCPAYNILLENFGDIYFSGIGVVKAFLYGGIKQAIASGLFACTLCKACKLACPLEIDSASLIAKIREIAAKNNLVPKASREMNTYIAKYGDPYGKSKGKKKKWYCC